MLHGPLLLVFWLLGSPASATVSRLDATLSRGDPSALADTTLPRLAELDAEQRHAIAEAIADWDVPRRVAAWAFLQVGMPYRLGPLGEEQPPDSDPLIAFESTDCAVLNLTSAALAHLSDDTSERVTITLANYREGRVGYETRFHFTTDRLDGSPYYRDITARVAGRDAQRRWVTLNRKKDGGRWIPISWTKRRQVVYVPRALGGRFAGWHDKGRIPAAMGVAFVQRARLADGLDVVHESLVWRGRTILHASSRTGRVVTLPWREFLAGPGLGYDGFVLFEYR